MPNATRHALRTPLSLVSILIGRMSAPTVRVLLTLTAIAALLSAAFIFKLIPSAFADTSTPVSIASFGTAVTQNFDTLVQSGTGTLAANTPVGWGFSEAATNANTSYIAGNGSGTAGDTYSFGSTTVPGDRALGQLRSSALISILGATFQNNTGGTITSLAVSYVGEQWRLGSLNRLAPERMDFQYSTNATSLTTGTWIDVNALDFNPPITGPTVGLLDGNDGANRIALSSTINGLSIPNGASFWIRWNDVDAGGADDGIAVDDFSITANGVPGDNAPTVTATSPLNNATDVAVGSNIDITFSESVSATASAFSIQCPNGSPQSFSQTASPSTIFTLNPTADLPYSTVCTVTVTASQITDTDVSDPPDQMASDVVFSFTTAAPPTPTPTPTPVATNVIINEVDADTPGTDTAEFIELYDGGVGNTSLNGLIVVLFNGSNDLSYLTVDLNGKTTDANGYFVMGDTLVPGVDMVLSNGFIQNGQDAVALYAASAASYPNNSPVSTTNLQDALVYDNGQADDPGLLVLLNAGQPQVDEGGTTSSLGRCPNGSGGGRNTSTYYQGTPSPDAASNCPPPQPPSTSPILISQVYGGGGNSGATYQNDFVELYNRSASPVDTAGWSIQYTSEDGDSWDFGKQPLGGTIGPGEYYLIALGSGGAIGAPLPAAQINGQINMGSSGGKVALVNSFDGLVGNCPLGDPSLLDFVGYGSPDCREGAAPAPAPSSSTSIFRLGGGSIDTNNNGSDFVTGTPNPRQTAPIVELGPLVLGTDPRKNGTNAARDASINVTFTEPVDVVGSWFDITCPSGQHNDATFAVTDGSRTHVITPNLNFVAGEQCTVTIFKDQIHDQDTDDANANTDGLPVNYVWTFTVATGTAPPYPSSVHLTMGDPGCGTIYGCAAASLGQPNNFLMDKPEFTISYNRDKGGPNWVSWHLTDEWIGSLTRVDTFRPDPGVPDSWYRVQAFDFSGSGFDRGHMTPNADRDKETSIPINQATFLMSNMVAQAPDNNQGPWAAFEGFLRTLLPGDEVYIVSGPFGVGGTGSAGPATTIANGHVTVPAQTWKVALVIPKASGDDTSRVSCSSRTIAVIMPNIQGIRNNPWENYLTTVDAVEQLTGYNFFPNLPPAVQACVEAGTNGTNPPGTADQSANTAEDNAVVVTLQALQANNNALTFSIVNEPTSGSLGSVSAASCASGTCTATVTYTPGADFNGSDSFTFRANDGPTNSNISTVNITVIPVNDDPDAVDDTPTIAEDSGDNVVNVLSNDTDVDTDTLTVSSVTQGTNGSVTNNSSSVTYTPNANFFGTDSFTYTISDGNGGNDTATVSVTVTNAQDAPDAVDDAASINEDSGANVIDVRANDTDLDSDTLSVTAVTQGAHGAVAITGGGTAVSYTPAANFFGGDSFTYTVSDGNGGTDTATVSVTVTNVEDAPDAVNDSPTVAEDSGANAIDVRANDSDLDGDTLTVTAVTQGTHGTVAITGSGAGVSYTPAANFFGSDSFTYTINDGQGGSDTATVSVTVTNVNDAPIATGEGYVTNSNTALNVAVPGVLGNDSDIDGPSLSAQLVSNVSHGTLSLQSNGSFTYTPTLDFEGADSFTYQAYDGAAASNVVTVNITVNDTVAPVLTSAVAVNLVSSTNSNLINVGLTASATDNSGNPVTIQVAVFGDEDDQTPTANNVLHSPDAKDIAPITLRLRGERIEANDGRVYLIIITATDSSGNISRNYQTVVVPKNNKQASIDSVNAQAAAAVSYAQSHAGAPPVGYFVIGDGPIIGPKQ